MCKYNWTFVCLSFLSNEVYYSVSKLTIQNDLFKRKLKKENKCGLGHFLKTQLRRLISIITTPVKNNSLDKRNGGIEFIKLIKEDIIKYF